MHAAPRTLLIVDDDAALVETFARMLRLDGYNVLTALDAETGWRLMATTRTDAVLLDLHMPYVDGLMFMRRLRALERDGRTPVAIITGDYSIDEDLVSELRELGAVLYFKPLWFEDLKTIIDRLLRTSH